METFSALLAICAGNSSVTGEFPTQRPVTRSFDVFFDLRLDKRLSKQPWGWWFETPSLSLWRHCNVCRNIQTTIAFKSRLSNYGALLMNLIYDRWSMIDWFRKISDTKGWKPFDQWKLTNPPILPLFTLSMTRLSENHSTSGFFITPYPNTVWDAKSHRLYSLCGRTSHRKISGCLEVAKFGIRFYNSPEIWQIPRQQRCPRARQIAVRYDHYNIQSRGFKTSRDLVVRRFTA